MSSSRNIIEEGLGKTVLKRILEGIRIIASDDYIRDVWLNPKSIYVDSFSEF